MRVPVTVGMVLLGIVGSVAVAVVVVALPALTAWPLIWLGAAAAVAPFAMMRVRGRIDPFAPVCLFAAGYALLFVVRPAVDLLNPNGVPTIVGYSPSPTQQLALLFSLVGLLSFYLGYYARVGPALAHAMPLPEAQLTPTLLRWGILLTLVVAVASYALFLASAGGLGVLQTVLTGRGALLQSTYLQSSGYLYSSPLWLTGPAILLLASTPHWRSARGISGLALLAISEVANAAQGNRSWTLVVTAMVVVLWYTRHRRRPSGKAIVVGLVVAFLVGVAAPAQYRSVDTRTGTFADAVGTAVTNPGEAVGTFIQGADTAMVDDFAIELQTVPAVAPYAFGHTYLDDLSAPMPRSLWTAKPTDGDDQLMLIIWPTYGSAHVGFSFSLFGEPYLNFGVIGVVVLCVAMGIAWRGLYDWFQRAPNRPAIMAVFAISWPFLFLYLWGGFGVGYPRQVIAMAPVLLILAVAEIRGRRRLSGRLPAAQPEAAR